MGLSGVCVCVSVGEASEEETHYCILLQERLKSPQKIPATPQARDGDQTDSCHVALYSRYLSRLCYWNSSLTIGYLIIKCIAGRFQLLVFYVLNFFFFLPFPSCCVES